MSSFLPTLAGSQALAPLPARRDLARIERVTTRDVARVQGKAHVLAERGRANAMAVESVAIDAMQAGTNVARHAVVLASACPAAEPILRSILDQTGLALGQTVSDTARDLR